MIRIKNWHKFQHFKDRDPPWIKLYRDLLDDPDWHELPGDDAKALMMLWLMADKEGTLPSCRKTAFRLRITEAKLNQLLNRLSHWLEQDDINSISDRYQDATTETETETYRGETETDSSSSKGSMASDWDFERFWSGYPRRVGKLAAQRAFTAAQKRGEVSFAVLMAAVGRIEASDPKFIPHPATWLNAGRYLDGQQDDAAPTNGGWRPGLPTDEELRAQYAQRAEPREVAPVVEDCGEPRGPEQELESNQTRQRGVRSLASVLRTTGVVSPLFPGGQTPARSGNHDAVSVAAVDACGRKANAS